MHKVITNVYGIASIILLYMVIAFLLMQFTIQKGFRFIKLILCSISYIVRSIVKELTTSNLNKLDRHRINLWSYYSEFYQSSSIHQTMVVFRNLI